MCLTRDQFRSQTFERDGNTCVFPGCGLPAVDPHHIMERALWLKTDRCPEGYLLNNGASLCEKHHIAAEQNHFPPQALRWLLDLPTVLPQQLDPAKLWDKWGEEIPQAPNTKWPRTPYFPFSPSIETGDTTIDPSLLVNKPLVLTKKMDGANVTITREKVTSRNGDTANGPQFDPLKALHAGFRWNIPENVILYGEWLFARHSIAYEGDLALDDLLMIFGIYEPKHQLFWGWDQVLGFCGENCFTTVPVIENVEFDAEWKLTGHLWEVFYEVVGEGHEGIVARSRYPFHHQQWGQNAGKMVREDHNQLKDRAGPIVKNEVRK